MRLSEDCGGGGEGEGHLSLMTSQCHVVLDVASLMLGRHNAVPIRLKILLDRLLGSLDEERVQAILDYCGWTCEDYQRGYKLQVHTVFS